MWGCRGGWGARRRPGMGLPGGCSLNLLLPGRKRATWCAATPFDGEPGAARSRQSSIAKQTENFNQGVGGFRRVFLSIETFHFK